MDDEKELEKRLCDMLMTGADGSMATGSSILSQFQLINSTSDAKTLSDLVGTASFTVIEDDSRWNPYPDLLVDLSGGMTPDVVLQSKVSRENRIYIEVKKTRPLRYGIADSQAVRYFLHLLATTRQTSAVQDGMRRAMLLAAPVSWFRVPANTTSWTYFLETYRQLATCFDITLAELHLEA